MNSPVTLVLAAVLLVFMARAAARIHAKASESGTRLREAEASVARLRSSQTTMSAKISELSTDAGVEASIREKYHAVSPGESVAVIVDDANTQNSAAEATTTETRSWWSRFWDAIGF
jgi:hypothetical protein